VEPYLYSLYLSSWRGHGHLYISCAGGSFFFVISLSSCRQISYGTADYATIVFFHILSSSSFSIPPIAGHTYCALLATSLNVQQKGRVVPAHGIKKAVFTLDAGLLARSQYSEGPATDHLDKGFSWFPCAYKQMLRWFPRFQVATTCSSCSPPDLNLVVTNFIFCIHVK